jgi:tRNA nucleotidyltransferase (CCA-adding enzyme)
MSEKKTRQDRKTATRMVNAPSAIRPLLQEIGRIADDHRVAAYAVGGCVRDWLLGLTRTADVDVAVVGDGIAFARQLAQAFGVGVTSHQQFGTATLVLKPTRGRQPIRVDVASCRKETYREPAAYPKVTAGSLQDDLFRRDFTINALAMAINPKSFGKLVDPFGGAQDLKARRLRILHPKSFLDDPSRILRAVRFTQRFGLAMDSQTLRCLRRAMVSGVLARLNRGRLRKELDRMAEEPDPIACLKQLNQWLSIGA